MKYFYTKCLLVILAIVVLVFKDRWILKTKKKEYAKIQSGRTPLSDATFCDGLTLDGSFVHDVSLIRSKLAERGDWDPLKIYIGDKLHPYFGLNDDMVGLFVFDLKIIPGYQPDYFPLNEVETVGDFVKTILRLKGESGEAKTGP